MAGIFVKITIQDDDGSEKIFHGMVENFSQHKSSKSALEFGSDVPAYRMSDIIRFSCDGVIIAREGFTPASHEEIERVIIHDDRFTDLED